MRRSIAEAQLLIFRNSTAKTMRSERRH